MWGHRPWQGPFLPTGLTSATQLAAYASWCTAVEGNTTFYASPSADTVSSWAEQAPADFRFVFKLPRSITHERRLRNVVDDVTSFLDLLAPLGERAATISIQLPPSFGPSDLGALAAFLRWAPASHRYAVEVRHPAFFGDSPPATALERMLTNAVAEWIALDTTTLFAEPPITDTERATWTNKPRLPVRTDALTVEPIVRFIGRDDPERTVAGWQRWVPVVVDWLVQGRSPIVFIHTPSNDDSLPLARRFHDDVSALLPGLAPLPDPVPTAPPTLF